MCCLVLRGAGGEGDVIMVLSIWVEQDVWVNVVTF